MQYHNLIAPVTKRSLQLFSADIFVVGFSLVFAVLLRFEFWPSEWEWWRTVGLLPILITSRMFALAYYGLHRWSFRLCGLPEAVDILKAQVIGSMIYIGLVLIVHGHTGIGSRGVLVIEFLISTLFLTTLRFGPRIYWGRAAQSAARRSRSSLRTIIVGAGQAGNLLVRDIGQRRNGDTFLVGFVDDDDGKQDCSIQGYKVLGRIDRLSEIIAGKRIQQVVVAIPSAKGLTIRKIIESCRGTGVKLQILPFSAALSDNLANASMLRDIDPADLLGRPEVEIDLDEFRAFFEGKVVLVTGAGGSIGSELARQVASFGPAKLSHFFRLTGAACNGRL